MAKILIVDDEPVILNLLNKILQGEGHEVTPASNGEIAIDLLHSHTFDLILSDIKMEPVDGMQLLKKARQDSPDTGIIMLTAYGSVTTAVEAMKEGAFDYITKPFKLDELLLTVQRALEYHSAIAENKGLKSQIEAQTRLENIIAESDKMSKVCQIVERVAPTNTTILIHGESGTGKELIAKALHTNSPRKDKPFIPVNCAALPESLLESEMFGHVKGAFTGASCAKDGLFEAADGGTLFLDEISAMPISLQSKLLRVLQDKSIRKVGGNDTIEVDVRVIVASNENLEEMIKVGTFRQDLYYRLGVITIELPPLRERKDDILPIAQHILRKYHPGEGPLPIISHEAQSVLAHYNWPGNVRELENVLQHALAFCQNNEINTETLPGKIVNSVKGLFESGNIPKASEEYKGKSLKAFLRSKEKDYLMNVIRSMDGDKEKAAKALNISLATLYRKIASE
jgi:DNA-binding NtrC family response regulator